MKKIGTLYLLVFGFCALANPSGDLNDKGQFISLQGEEMPSSAFLGVGLGYGQNIVFQRSYLGFFAVNLKFNSMFDDSLYNNEAVKRMYFTEFDWGYEFMRHNIFSFGLDTSHGVGLTYKGKAAFSNGIGAFGKIQKDSFSFSVGCGIKHLNPFHSIAYERTDSYWRLKFQYRL